jgi:hypothetical protein
VAEPGFGEPKKPTCPVKPDMREKHYRLKDDETSCVMIYF